MEIHHACHRRPSDYPINLGPVHRTSRPSRCNCRWGCPCPCRPRTSTSPTRSRRSSIRPASRSRPRLFRALIEKADQELVLQNRRGKAGAGIQRRGTRPFTFKTTFGEVTVQRSRISHKHDDTIEVPSARAWETSHQLHITRNLRDAVCDQFQRMDPRARAVPRSAATPGMRTCSRGSSTIIDIVHQEGEQLVRANVRARPRGSWTERPRPSWPLLGPAAADPDALTGLVDDDLPLDELGRSPSSRWEQIGPGRVDSNGLSRMWSRRSRWPRTNPAVDEGFVIDQSPMRVKTKAPTPKSNGSARRYGACHGGGAWWPGLRSPSSAEATAEGLWLQVSALLLVGGVLGGSAGLLVLGDGAAWIRAWFESLGISLQAMILCWWHLRKRCL